MTKLDGRRPWALAQAQVQRETWAVALTVPDRELLRQRDEEKLTYQRLATRYGVTRHAIERRVQAARRRERVRETLPQDRWEPIVVTSDDDLPDDLTDDEPR